MLPRSKKKDIKTQWNYIPHKKEKTNWLAKQKKKC